jgi:hypothetical protein
VQEFAHMLRGPRCESAGGMPLLRVLSRLDLQRHRDLVVLV